MTRSQRSQRGSLALLLLMGGLAGSVLGEACSSFLPVLGNSATVGFGPATLNLHFCKFTLGFSLALGPLTMLGLLLGYWLHRRV
ncbi:DUF4321 domain-containing protein [Desulfothermobacter acidiphilus]|uniref:DUF4321 domain-containing protein n=1 Tax=Desulfothermobacter acidiphilus TaxID=1938353 RepID=UPI003F89D502